MVNVYEIRFVVIETIKMEKEDDQVGSIKEEEPEIEEFEKLGVFHLACSYLTEATLKAIEMLDDMIGEGEYDIVAVARMDNINLLNFPEEECPFCGVEESPEDELLRFKCVCNQDIVVKDTGWKFINCPSCDIEIPRDRIIGNNGNYIFIHTLDKKEES